MKKQSHNEGNSFNLIELLEECPKNEIIVNNLIIAYSKINSSLYDKILCSVSGGADSDIVIDVCVKCDINKKIDYVCFDTGLEYKATKNHLKYLEKKYGIKIKIEKAIKPIPVSCKEFGVPFLSKQVSQFIEGLQRHNFKWEDKSYEELRQEYSNCDSYLKWWCNTKQKGTDKRFCIAQNKYLKEFLIQNPPPFKISSSCCKYAKKDLSKQIIKRNNYDLVITGVRKAEGGQRATAYKNCFDENKESCDRYRPVFWYLNDTKLIYDRHYKIKHSDCYEKYGFKRTGCAACPYGGRDLEDELVAIEKYEPNLYKAANHIFGKSYEYTRLYYKFMEEIEKQKLKSECEYEQYELKFTN